jgi:hypothetical protein
MVMNTGQYQPHYNSRSNTRLLSSIDFSLLTVYPNLPVLDGLEEVLHVELVSQGRAIILKATENLCLLGRGQEFGGIWIVVHYKVGHDCYRMSSQSTGLFPPCFQRR